MLVYQTGTEQVGYNQYMSRFVPNYKMLKLQGVMIKR